MSQDITNANTAREEMNERQERPESQETLTRREFLNKLSLALSGLGAAIVGIPVIGFLVAPLLGRAPEIWRPLGPVTQFKIGETVQVSFLDPSPLPWAGIVSRTAAWLRRDSDQDFTAFSVNCTHLGCPVSWLQGP